MRCAYVYQVTGERWALLRGPVGRWLRERRIPAMRTNIHNGWWIHVSRIADLMAELEVGGFLVRFSPHGAPAHCPPQPRRSAA